MFNNNNNVNAREQPNYNLNTGNTINLTLNILSKGGNQETPSNNIFSEKDNDSIINKFIINENFEFLDIGAKDENNFENNREKFGNKYSNKDDDEDKEYKIREKENARQIIYHTTNTNTYNNTTNPNNKVEFGDNNHNNYNFNILKDFKGNQNNINHNYNNIDHFNDCNFTNNAGNFGHMADMKYNYHHDKFLVNKIKDVSDCLNPGFFNVIFSSKNNENLDKQRNQTLNDLNNNILVNNKTIKYNQVSNFNLNTITHNTIKILTLEEIIIMIII